MTFALIYIAQNTKGCEEKENSVEGSIQACNAELITKRDHKKQNKLFKSQK